MNQRKDGLLSPALSSRGGEGETPAVQGFMREPLVGCSARFSLTGTLGPPKGGTTNLEKDHSERFPGRERGRSMTTSPDEAKQKSNPSRPHELPPHPRRRQGYGGQACPPHEQRCEKMFD